MYSCSKALARSVVPNRRDYSRKRFVVSKTSPVPSQRVSISLAGGTKSPVSLLHSPSRANKRACKQMQFIVMVFWFAYCVLMVVLLVCKRTTAAAHLWSAQRILSVSPRASSSQRGLLTRHVLFELFNTHAGHHNTPFSISGVWIVFTRACCILWHWRLSSLTSTCGGILGSSFTAVTADRWKCNNNAVNMYCM